MPTLSLTGPGTVSEGNSGVTYAVYSLTLSAAPSSPVTLSYSTEGSSPAPSNAATAGSDYQATQGTVTFEAGQTTATISVPVYGDGTVEPDETIALVLSNLSGADLAADVTAALTAVIRNDDLPPPNQAPTVAGAIASQTAPEGSPFTFTLPATLFADPEQGSLTLAATQADGSALPSWLGFDPASRTFFGTPPAGAGDSSIKVTATDSGGLDASTTFTIATPVPPTATLVRTGSYSSAEGNGGTTDIGFQARLSQAAAADVTLAYTIRGYGANQADASDFTATTGTVTIRAGQTTADFTVAVVGDAVAEQTEGYQVRLTGVTGGPATLSDSGNIAIGYIQNDDLPPPTATLTRLSNSYIAEGDGGTTNALFQVRLSSAATADVTIGYTIPNAGYGATANDFAATSGTVTVRAGQTTADFAVGILGDTVVEQNEYFQVRLTGVTGGPATLADSGTSAYAYIQNDDLSPPTVSLTRSSGAYVTEGDTGTTSATFQMLLSRAATSDVVVNYTVGGYSYGSTPAGGNDLTTTGGSVTIRAGQTSADFSVGIVGDTVYEQNEAFQVRLTGATGAPATLADTYNTQYVAYIQNDDLEPPSVGVLRTGSYSVDEGDSGTTAVPFQIGLSRSVTSDVVVEYSIAGSSHNGTNSGDFTATRGSVTIRAGQSSANFSVQIAGDNTYEPDEYYTVRLTEASGHPELTINSSSATATGVIRNDDEAPPTATLSFVRSDNSTLYTSEGTGDVTGVPLQVTLSRAAPTDITLNYTIGGYGYSTAGADDFQATAGTVTVPAGQTSATFSVGIVGDATQEQTEGYQVRLTAPNGTALVSQSATVYGYIENDDLPPPVVSLNYPDTSTFTEGNSGVTATDDAYSIRLSRAASTDVTVAYAIAGYGSSAASADDFQATTGTVTIPAGETSANLSIGIVGDTVIESNEGFRVRLTGVASGRATLSSGSNQYSGTILNDDTAATATLARAPGSSAAVNEGTGTVTNVPLLIRLNRPLSADATIEYTVNGYGGYSSSANDDDFVVSTGEVRMHAGDTSATFTIQIDGDSDVESNEGYQVRLTEVVSGPVTLSGSSVTGTIRNDDLAPPSLSVSDVYPNEDGEAVFTVRRSGNLRVVSTVPYATTDGTAQAGADYTATTGTLTFAAGETVKTVRVPLVNDTIHESQETFMLVLGDVQGAVASDHTAQANIRDNDVAAPSRDDYTSTIATRGRLALGRSSTGWIERGGDADWFRVSLARNVDYLVSAGPVESGALEAVQLQIRDARGRLVTTVPTTGGEEEPYEFRPGVSGTFYLAVKATSSTDTGQYELFIEKAEDAADTATATTVRTQSRSRPPLDLTAVPDTLPLSGAAMAGSVLGGDRLAAAGLLAAV